MSDNGVNQDLTEILGVCVNLYTIGAFKCLESS